MAERPGLRPREVSPERFKSDGCNFWGFTFHYSFFVCEGLKNFTILTDFIPWWINALSKHAPREISFDYSTPAVIYTDACGAGRVGAVISRRGCQHVYRCHLPKWLVQQAGIYEFELAGVLFGVLCAIEREHGSPLVVFCDNRGANGSVIRAASKTAIGRANGSVIWGAAAAAGSSIWIEYVASALNLGDPLRENAPPSRIAQQGWVIPIWGYPRPSRPLLEAIPICPPPKVVSPWQKGIFRKGGSVKKTDFPRILAQIEIEPGLRG